MKASIQTYGVTLALIISWLLVNSGYAQQRNQNDVQTTGSVPLLRVNVVERSTKAVNYRHRSGATKVDFAGTSLQAGARGEAKVESKKGYIEIEVEFDDLVPADKFGAEYLTYVLWAITPEGRSKNLGEILLNSEGEGKLNVSTEFQAFGMIVTAEPHFAVSQPSDVVVMENIIRPSTKGKVEEIDAKYELLQRGVYTLNVDASKVHPTRRDPKTPLELLEARHAVQIARWAGADRDASETFSKAESLLNQAEDYQTRKSGKKSVIMTAREAAQTAEDARLIARKRQDEQRAAAERSAAEARVEEESRKRAEAEAERLAAERAKREAEAATQAAQVQKLEAQAEADRARRLAEEAQLDRQKAEREKSDLRAALTQQLNMVLETKDSLRGLIVNMSDVLFDTAKYSLRPAAREKLSKIAGIVLAHPGLKLEVEGHTDSQGSDEYNQQLSENRAAAARDYLVQQGIPLASIVARGFGETQPVVTNDTTAGRQQNRRVELVVSGEPIGVRQTSMSIR